MASTACNQIFCFLDLPDEHRARTYDFYVEACCPVQIDITEVKSLLPETGLLLASRQLYQETINLLEQARSAFWRNHSLVLSFHRPLTDSTTSSDSAAIIRAARSLHSCPIRTLVVQISGSPHVLTTDILYISLNNEDELAVSSESLASNGSRFYKAFWALSWQMYLEGRYETEGIELKSRAHRGCLDVLGVCEAVCARLMVPLRIGRS